MDRQGQNEKIKPERRRAEISARRRFAAGRTYLELEVPSIRCLVSSYRRSNRENRQASDRQGLPPTKEKLQTKGLFSPFVCSQKARRHCGPSLFVQSISSRQPVLLFPDGCISVQASGRPEFRQGGSRRLYEALPGRFQGSLPSRGQSGSSHR